MRMGSILLVLIGLGGLCGRGTAQDRPVVAMIGTGNLGGTFGPAIGRAGYPVVYGSRNPDRDLVRALVERTGASASATTPREAAARAEIIVLAVPSEVLEEVTRNLGELDGKILVDVSGGRKRVAADGYLELVSDSTNSERLQSRHPTARVLRIGLPGIFFFADPLLVGTRPTVPIAADDPRAREVVAHLIFDVGLDPWDAGPLRFSRVFDAWGLLSMVPAQQGRVEGYDLKLMPSVPWSCIFDPAEAFGFGRPYDLDSLPRFPRRDPPVSCDEWRRRIGIGDDSAPRVGESDTAEYRQVTREDADRFHRAMTLDNWDDGGALSRFVYIHPSEFFPTAVIERMGPVSQLAYELNPDIGAQQTEWVDASGRTATIDELVADDPGLDGVIVLHRGRIVYEAYPRMRPTDKHLLMSVTKPVVGAAVGLLEDRGVIDLGEPIDAYMPELDGTDWSGIPVRDVLEMLSGIEGTETVGEAFNDPTHKHYQMEASLGWLPLTPQLPEAVHRGETYEFLMSLERLEEPGTKYSYTSSNTVMLGWLLERVTNKPLARVLHEEIWSHLGAESDALLVVNDLGIPVAHAGMATTLRDLARFGLLFTESWDVVSEERVVSEQFSRRIRQGRSELFDPNSRSSLRSAYQWDAETGDGVLRKLGFAGQILIVHPTEDLVLAQFGTNSDPESEPRRRFRRREPSAERGPPTARTLWRVILDLYGGG